SDLVHKVVFTPTGHHVITVSSDATVRFWNTETCRQVFSIPLPAKPYEVGITNNKVRDFDFHCSNSDCLLAVPLVNGKMVIYEFKGFYSRN
ncbi:MAG: hypothetical protein D3923_11340, partial [Candidatus Electrothrix sp. AR3]|nr:hypothetical protein [Candidatus Electrothrix sp. AR3]